MHLLSITDAGVPPTLPVEQLYPTTWNPMRLVETIAAIDGVRAARRIGVDGMTPMFEQLIGAVLPDVELADGEAALRAARRVKQPEEIDGIRAAVAMAEDAFGATLTALRPGVRERELVGVFEARMAMLGSSTPAYEGTFCVVDDGGPIRRITSERPIEDGDLVAMSAGVLRAGWEGSPRAPWCAGRRPTTSAAGSPTARPSAPRTSLGSWPVHASARSGTRSDRAASSAWAWATRGSPTTTCSSRGWSSASSSPARACSTRTSCSSPSTARRR